jgi:hypothetical protein
MTVTVICDRDRGCVHDRDRGCVRDREREIGCDHY